MAPVIRSYSEAKGQGGRPVGHEVRIRLVTSPRKLLAPETQIGKPVASSFRVAGRAGGSCQGRQGMTCWGSITIFEDGAAGRSSGRCPVGCERTKAAAPPLPVDTTMRWPPGIGMGVPVTVPIVALDVVGRGVDGRPERLEEPHRGRRTSSSPAPGQGAPGDVPSPDRKTTDVGILRSRCRPLRGSPLRPGLSSTIARSLAGEARPFEDRARTAIADIRECRDRGESSGHTHQDRGRCRLDRKGTAHDHRPRLMITTAEVPCASSPVRDPANIFAPQGPHSTGKKTEGHLFVHLFNTPAAHGQAALLADVISPRRPESELPRRASGRFVC